MWLPLPAFLAWHSSCELGCREFYFQVLDTISRDHPFFSPWLGRWAHVLWLSCLSVWLCMRDICVWSMYVCLCLWFSSWGTSASQMDTAAVKHTSSFTAFNQVAQCTPMREQAHIVGGSSLPWTLWLVSCANETNQVVLDLLLRSSFCHGHLKGRIFSCKTVDMTKSFFLNHGPDLSSDFKFHSRLWVALGQGVQGDSLLSIRIHMPLFLGGIFETQLPLRIPLPLLTSWLPFFSHSLESPESLPKICPRNP